LTEQLELYKSLDDIRADRIGIIQSRGLGDLFIALPIALHFKEQGKTVYWPICEPFMKTMTACAPWVTWLPLPVDARGEFFYDSALRALAHAGVQDHVCLYQFLSNMPQLSDPDLFPILKFDQYKYAVAGVPFKNKQRLAECIQRDPAAEARVYKQVVRNHQRYIVVHLEGSDRRMDLDFSEAESAGYQVVEIREGVTDRALDWLKVIEGAHSLYLIDSVYANIVDGLDIHRDKWFIRRSKMDLTPVLLSDWQYFPVSELGIK
jgi:hypothetical protein